MERIHRADGEVILRIEDWEVAERVVLKKILSMRLN